MAVAAAIGALILTVLGFIGTVSMLIMNLRVTSSMAELRSGFTADVARVELSIANMRGTDISRVELSIATLRADLAKENSALYQTITANVGTVYMNRKESEAMHADNKNRLDRIDSRLESIEERLPV